MKYILILTMGLGCLSSYAQVPVMPPKKVLLNDGPVPGNTTAPVGNESVTDYSQTSNRKDSIAFEHRDDAKDSISISFRYLDSTRKAYLDSSVNDFDKYFSIPSSYAYLGNNGSAAYSLIYQSNSPIGFDPGFHAYDLYRFTLAETRFYRTTRPYSQLNYQLASGKEQMLKASHTQNPKPNFNWGFDYKLINAPGFFVTQNTNHNSSRLFGSYEGKRKRYHAWISWVNNNIRASENGGVESVADLSDPNRKDRFAVPVNLGNSAAYRPNPFVTAVTTGNQYKYSDFFLRQSYDLGKHDSIAVNDSTKEYLFYPKLRLMHSFTYTKRSFQFGDVSPDSTVYDNWYQIKITPDNDTLNYKDWWEIYNNSFSILQFPDTKNQAQFFMGGISWQQIHGQTSAGSFNFYNLSLQAEYRNRTRNKKWDLLLKGELYFNGLNAGDYQAFGSISRYLSKRMGSVNLYFKNINRTPSFIFDPRSSFHMGDTLSLKKENHTSFGVSLSNSFIDLSFHNHLIVNSTYFTSKKDCAQYLNPINILQFSASKKIKLHRKWFWYADVTLQPTDNAAPIRLPFLFSRNRIAFEGRFFKNLNLCTGIEMRYFSPFKANGYSPLNGQFYTQDSMTINNRPDVAAFLHFNIRSFTGYLRTENLNTMDFSNGFSFTRNNFAAPYYPTPGMIIRFGVQWRFVN